MKILKFEDIDYLFDVYDKKELFWYEKAWSVLAKQNLTQYNNIEQYAYVLIRAVTLKMIYDEFLSISDIELLSYAYWDILEILDKDFGISPVLLGMLYSKLNSEYTSDANYSLCILADSQRSTVIHALLNELTTMEFLSGMYFTRTSFYEFDDEHEINNYIEYYEAVQDNIKALEDDVRYSLCDYMHLINAMGWICDGTYAPEAFEDYSDIPELQ